MNEPGVGTVESNVVPPKEVQERLTQRGKDLLKEIGQRVRESQEGSVSLEGMKVGEVRGCLAVAGKPYPKKDGARLVFDEQTGTVIGFQVRRLESGYECALVSHGLGERSPLVWEGDKPRLNDDYDLGELFSASEVAYHTAGDAGQSFDLGDSSFGVEWDGGEEKMVALKFTLLDLKFGAIPVIGSNSGKGEELVFASGADLNLGEESPLLPISSMAQKMIEKIVGEVRNDEIILKTWGNSVQS